MRIKITEVYSVVLIQTIENAFQNQHYHMSITDSNTILVKEKLSP
jgi:hypothetical protein